MGGLGLRLLLEGVGGFWGEFVGDVGVAGVQVGF